MRLSRILAVDHVKLEAPLDAREELRSFYGELVGLDEIPAAKDQSNTVRFKSEHIEICFELCNQPAIDPVPCRVTITVPSLDSTMEWLNEQKTPFDRLTGMGGNDRRIQVADPAGHRIELKQESRPM